MMLIEWCHRLIAWIASILGWRRHTVGLPAPVGKELTSYADDLAMDSNDAADTANDDALDVIENEPAEWHETRARIDMTFDPEYPRDDTAPSSADGAGIAYATGLEYLRDELARVALLVKAYAIRRLAAEETCRSPLDVVTQIPFRWEHLATEAKWFRSWEDQLHEAKLLQERIARRLGLTAPSIRNRFPLVRLQRILEEDTPAAEHRHLVSLQRDVLLVAFLDYHVAVYRSGFGKLTTDDGTCPGGLAVGMACEICHPLRSHSDDPLSLCGDHVPLVRDHYVEIGDPGIDPARRRMQIDPVVAAYLLETSNDDPELHEYVTWNGPLTSWDDLLLDKGVRDQLRALSERLPRSTAVILLHGPSGGPHVSAARAVLSASCRPLIVADVSRAISLPDWNHWVARVFRMARLHGAAILWDRATAILETSRTDPRWKRLMRARRDLPVFLSAETAWDPDSVSNSTGTAFVRIEFPIPSAEVRRLIWKHQLECAHVELSPETLSVALDLLASFQFTEGQVADAITIARGLELTDSNPDPEIAEHLYAACRRVSARGLVSFTQRIPPRDFGPDPLAAVILPPESRQQLQELNDRIENMDRVYYEYGFGDSLCLGRGLISLFAGPSGTGKTLAATVLASCRQRDLYKVDMSAVVSKYVGETEKNLARVFSDAQSAGALLFFDEADAIFGKRGEIDKAQDRWANMEVNYLLQRVEDFAGVVILATNLKQNIDEAFLRRVQVLIDFKLPDAKDRQKILTAMFPHDVIPPSAEDIKAFCEQLELSGGNLKNVAVDAAFRALRDQRSFESTEPHPRLVVALKHLVLAAAREYRKLSRPVTLASFGRRFYDIVKNELLLD